MLSPTAAPTGLDTLIRDALKLASDAGRSDVVSTLEAALSASGTAQPEGCELDILAAEVRRGGRLIKLSRGELALMMALALRRRPCTRAELVELLYFHLEEATAATQLKVYVHRVRRRLDDPGAILHRNGTYCLGPSVAVDLWDVEAEVAQAMRSKAPLSSETRNRLDAIRQRLVRRSAALSTETEWGAALERRLETLLFDVTTRLGEAALAARDTSTASRLAAEILTLDPCDERGAELAIRTHLAAGDRGSAVRELRRYERTLKVEFAAQPSPELCSLITAQGR
ncbi:MAG: hypothetical protein JO359_09430 [Candidatus Eremiobacteraeota bacterium]|nr:hypothetical protein [Candidatus Eremiobacteraeota bacterium]